MKFFVLALLLGGSGIIAHGQLLASVGAMETGYTNMSPLVMNDVQRVAYKIAYPPGYRMRNTGRTLAIIGGAMLVGGIIVYDQSVKTYYYSGANTYEEVPPAAIGALMIVGGIGMTIPGIILWTKGARKFKRHMERQNTTVSFNGSSLSLRYRF